MRVTKKASVTLPAAPTALYWTMSMQPTSEATKAMSAAATKVRPNVPFMVYLP